MRRDSMAGNVGGGMIVSLQEIKEYLRIDFADEDVLLENLLQTAHQLCMDVARMAEGEAFSQDMAQAKTAVLYAAAYLYEHREEADHHALMLTLRALLYGIRQEGL